MAGGSYEFVSFSGGAPAVLICGTVDEDSALTLACPHPGQVLPLLLALRCRRQRRGSPRGDCAT